MGATEIFRTFTEGQPDLVDLGIGPVSRVVGGVFPGNLVGLAAGQNVGKSSMLLLMATSSQHPGGVISMEDGEDVWVLGSWRDTRTCRPPRSDARISREDDKDRLSEALGHMQRASEAGRGPWIAYRIGGSIEDVEDAVKQLAEAGCRWIALDYLQKPRGHSTDRRTEVGVTMNRFHKACADAGVVPVIMSQIVRMKDGVEPFPAHMKESGDIENECRLILMFWRDPQDSTILRGKVAKSSFGGGGLRFAYKFTPAEYLIEIDPRDYPDEPDDDLEEDF